MITCSCCKESRGVDEFYPYTKPDKSKGRRSICKMCDKKRARKFLDAQGSDYARNNQFKVRYGITLEQYNGMFEEQSGCCAICHTHQLQLDKRLAVDHCHDTGKVRKLLCSACNMAIGLLKHDIKLLISAANYLTD